MGSKYVDVAAIMQVIGTVYKDPSILDNENYHFTELDFPLEFHKIVFGSIYNLYQLGAKEITVAAIEDYLSQRPKKMAIYTSNRGSEYLLKLSENVQLSAFQYYYDRMKKMTLLRMYGDKCGMDLSWLYDVDNILDTKKKQAQEDFLDKASLVEVANLIDSKIEKIKKQCLSDNIHQNSAMMGDGGKELKERLKKSPAFGLPLYGDYINTVTRGARLGKFYLRSAPTGVGKALPNDLYIPTPRGYKRVGDIKVGEGLFGSNGLPTRVLQIHPQETDKEIWIVTFEDGRTTRCCKDHLWTYYTDKKHHVCKTATTEEIYLEGKSRRYKDKGRYSYRTPLNQPLQFPHKEIKIPDDYFTAAIDQRISYLQQLFDNFGVIHSNGDIIYKFRKIDMANMVTRLLRELGFWAKQTEYIVQVPKENYYFDSLFSFEKKNKKMVKTFIADLPIIKIEPTKEKVPMTCFTVAAADSLFVINDGIVTHNTRTMIADACYLGCSNMYDTPSQQWISIGMGQPTLYIATEQDLEECQTMCWAFLSGVNEEHILQNSYAEGEEVRVDKAIDILNTSKIYFECIPDFSLQDIESIIKQHIRDNNVRLIFFDYIHTSMKILEEITKRSGGVKLREDNVLFMLSTKLKDICVQYNVFIMSSTQLNGNYGESETPDQNLLRGSKAVADRLDFGSILLDVTKDDLTKLKPLLDRGGIKPPNVKLSVYKNRQGRWRGIYLWMDADKGSCRYNPIFATDFNYKYIEMDNIKIKVKEESAF